MLKARSVVKAAIGAALLTLVTVAATLLTLMFSTGSDDVGERKAFFGSLVFETVDKANGATSITTGVDNPVPVIALFLVLTVALTMVQIIYRGLKQRRDQLLNEMPGN
ncbi:hypothetical protein GCM10023080_014000 [Streptomyces pseudoechinosporeus]